MSRIEAMLDAIESHIADFAVRLGSWLAPLPVAYLIGNSAIVHLGWPLWVAIIGAVVVELLGLATVNLALTFRAYNAEKTRKNDPDAPFKLAVAMVAVYYITVILLTVALEVIPQMAILAPVVFTGLSLTGAGCLMLRKDHARRLAVIAKDKEKRSKSQKGKRSERSERVRNAKPNALEATNAKRQAGKIAALIATLEYLADNPTASLAEIGAHIGRGKSTVSSYLSELEATGRLSKNGDGWEVL